jgi:hypothetical protein
MISFATPTADTDSSTVIAAHNPAQDCGKAPFEAVGLVGHDAYAKDLDRCEGDPCFFCGMGELAAQRMEGRIA